MFLRNFFGAILGFSIGSFIDNYQKVAKSGGALHHCRLEEAPAAVVEVRNAGALGWFQICDGPSTAPSDLIAEARGGRMVPGEGELPLVELITAIGPSVAVSVEVQGLEHRYPDPVSRATMLLARTRSVLSRV